MEADSSANAETTGGETTVENHLNTGRSVRKRKATPRPGFTNDYSQKPKTSPQKSKRGRPKKADSKGDAELEFQTSWICAECKEAECLIKPEAEQLIVCEGPCHRLFHYPCANLTELPAEDVDFYCQECNSKRHRCAFCQDSGEDDIDVFRCCRPNCGLFFHEACLVMQNIDVNSVSSASEKASVVGSESQLMAETPEDEERPLPQFTCPAHSCWTCTQENAIKEEQKYREMKVTLSTSGKKRAKRTNVSCFDQKTEHIMVRCMECPKSFHISCIPPMARFHELALLCHEDESRHKLPDLDSESSLQMIIEKKVDEKFGNQTLRERQTSRNKGRGENLFVPGVQGNALTPHELNLVDYLMEEGEDQSSLFFCLPVDVKIEVHAKPTTYHHIHSLKYDLQNRPPKQPLSNDSCDCTGVCGNECLNRILYVECTGNGKNDSSTSRTTTNCNVGPACGNRGLAKRQIKKCRPAREQGKGWGLVTMEEVKKGDLVQEYLGEVIDTEEKERRLADWAKEHPNDPNFYVMALQSGWFLDARVQGNLSRFINHSCEPNCRLSAINVGGSMRNGIFALKDIVAGEFLSYDYQFDTRHGDRFTCHCGAVKCRGTMKGGVAADDKTDKTKAEAWEEAKAKFDRDKKWLSEYYEDEIGRCNQVAATVPAAESKDELVANGAQERIHRDSGRSFLWRNARQGSDFVSRVALLER